jgi:transposase-like protein
VSQLKARQEVGELLGINPSTLGNWIRRDLGEGVTPSTAGQGGTEDELTRLRRENAQLRRANEILKTASAFSRRRSSTADSDSDRLRPRVCGTVRGGTELRQAYAANRLFDLWTANRRLYGRRKLWTAARRAGLHLGRDQVERLMKLAGVDGVRHGQRRTVTTTSDLRRPRRPRAAAAAVSAPGTARRSHRRDVFKEIARAGG